MIWIAIVLAGALLALTIYEGMGNKLSDWGNHCSFVNETGWHIDSIHVTLGNEVTAIVASVESSGAQLAGQLVIPEQQERTVTGVLLFTDEGLKALPIDQYPCKDCDIQQWYTLTKEGAVYGYSP